MSTAEGDQLIRKAQSLISSASKGGLFDWGSKDDKYEDAAEKYKEAGAAYRMTSNLIKAAQAYEEASKIYDSKLNQKFNKASALKEAAKCYQEDDLDAAIRCLQASIDTSESAGNSRRAAEDISSDSLGLGRLLERQAREIQSMGIPPEPPKFLIDEKNEAYENPKWKPWLEEVHQHWMKAIQAWNKAAGIYNTEVTSQLGNKCRDAIGRIYATLPVHPNYHGALAVFDVSAKKFAHDDKKRLFIPQYLFSEGLCVVAIGDSIRTENTFKEFQQLVPDFFLNREGQFLKTIASALEAKDPEAIDLAKKNIWRTTLPEWQNTVVEKIKADATPDPLAETDYT